MGPRRAVDEVMVDQPIDLQDQYEDLEAQQLDLRAEMAQKQQELRDKLDKRHAELLQMVSAIKNSFDGLQLSQQSKDTTSTSTARDKVLQSGQGILGPNPYCVNATRNHNLIFSRFNGENLKTWLYRIEQYFSDGETPLNQRVRLVAMNLDDEALAWHQSYIKCKNLPVLPARDEYIAELIEAFSGDFSDPMLELKQLKQTGSIREFQFAFDRLVAQCNLTVEQAISCFLDGLKEELVNPIMMHEPKTLQRLGPVVRSTPYQAVVPAPWLTLPVATNVIMFVLELESSEASSEVEGNIHHNVELPLKNGLLLRGKQHILNDVSKDCRLSSPKDVNRYQSDEVQLFMLQVMIDIPPSDVEYEGILCALHLPDDAVLPQPLSELLDSYKQVFSEPTTLPPQRGAFDQEIPLQPKSKPVNIRPYRYSSMKKDIIEKASARNVTTRGATIFSKIDLRFGYYQIRMVPKDVSKVAFKTHMRHYEYLAMPFGLTNATSTFQCLMNHILQEFVRKFVLVFFDYILVYSRNLQDYILHLQWVFEVMVQNNLLAKHSKCVFGLSSVEYLGHFISTHGVATDPRKIATVQQLPTPVNVKQLKGFPGLTGYYRKFIKGCGLIISTPKRPVEERQFLMD
ncbi:uncharacterized protein LOC142178099 [Nicotiana tabacum]|uniref:Uncharacterized protein LOC142178099 n=1 Tax=Nicotiana tabacum TaxID=4097 RepID=A0AC58U213_TOBAC